MENFQFIDLFAGLGGFHLALERLGGKCVFAAEWKEHLRDLYSKNFGIRPDGDIRKIDPHSIPDHDLLTAGFPCQPFSKAGEQLGFECTEQGTLFHNVVNVLNAKRPHFFILENVPNLLKHNKGETWQQIQSALRKLDYHIAAKQYSPHNFGIPQIRERIYIVGSLTPLNNLLWPETSESETSIDSILDSFPQGAKSLSSRVQECLEIWNKFLHSCPKNIEIPSFPLWSMEWGATYPFENTTPWAITVQHGTDGFKGFKGSHGKRLGHLRSIDAVWDALPSHARTAEPQFPNWKKNFIRQNREFYANNSSWINPWIQNILPFPSSLQKLEWNIKGGERDIWKYVIQFRASGVRIKRRTTAPSLIAMTDTQVPIIAWQKRYMTPQECARLQSLDELKEFPKSTTQTFHALGNAVNSRVVEKVASALLATAKADNHNCKPSKHKAA